MSHFKLRTAATKRKILLSIGDALKTFTGYHFRCTQEILVLVLELLPMIWSSRMSTGGLGTLHFLIIFLFLHCCVNLFFLITFIAVTRNVNIPILDSNRQWQVLFMERYGVYNAPEPLKAFKTPRSVRSNAFHFFLKSAFTTGRDVRSSLPVPYQRWTKQFQSLFVSIISGRKHRLVDRVSWWAGGSPLKPWKVAGGSRSPPTACKSNPAAK